MHYDPFLEWQLQGLDKWVPKHRSLVVELRAIMLLFFMKGEN
jgi:hypothetical protein